MKFVWSHSLVNGGADWSETKPNELLVQPFYLAITTTFDPTASPHAARHNE
jgi:hypothetical protein